jgi:hypothetical protein
LARRVLAASQNVNGNAACGVIGFLPSHESKYNQTDYGK